MPSQAERLASGTSCEHQGQTRLNMTPRAKTTCFVKMSQDPRTICFMSTEGVLYYFLIFLEHENDMFYKYGGSIILFFNIFGT
jgi:hypothetical protein